MNFKREKRTDYYLLNTEIENIFIDEYMASAPGDYVKVYLFSLMYADLKQEMEHETIAKHLGLKEEDVLKAWSYWESEGVVRKYRKKPEDKFHYKVEFINLKERLYGKGAKKTEQDLKKSTKQIASDKEVQSMYSAIERMTGKALSGTEMMEILSWVNNFYTSPEVAVYAYSYCKEKKKTNVRYVAAVVKSWMSQGLTNIGAIEEYLQSTDERRYLYKRICRALGFARNATEREEKIIDTWFDDMEFTIDKVLEACSKTTGISNPNINYVNKVLSNWYEESTGKTADGKPKAASVAVVRKYYEHLRKTAEQETGKRRKEAYTAIPRLQEIESEMDRCRRDISRLIISDRMNKKSEIESLQRKSDKLSQEQTSLLTNNSFEPDYLDIKYKCVICKDTGTNDSGERCECFPLRTQEAQEWQKNLK